MRRGVFHQQWCGGGGDVGGPGDDSWADVQTPQSSCSRSGSGQPHAWSQHRGGGGIGSSCSSCVTPTFRKPRRPLHSDEHVEPETPPDMSQFASDVVQVWLSVNRCPFLREVTLSKLLNNPLVFPLNVEAIKGEALRYNGAYELQFSLHYIGDQLPLKLYGRVVGEVMLDGLESGLSSTVGSDGSCCITGCSSQNGREHYLGPLLQEQGEAVSAVMVWAIPSDVLLTFRLDTRVPVECVAPLPSELLLADHVRTIVDNDEYRSSLLASHVQNQVIGLPFYKKGSRRFSSWTRFMEFFEKHYEMWVLIRYTEKDVENHGFRFIKEIGEPRVVSIKTAKDHVRNDKARDVIRGHAVTELQETVHWMIFLQKLNQDAVVRATAEAEWAQNDEVESGSYEGTERSSCVCGGGHVEEQMGAHRCLRLSKKGSSHFPPSMLLTERNIVVLARSRSFQVINSVSYLKILRYAAMDTRRTVLFNSLHPIRMDRRRGTTSPELVAHPLDRCVAKSSVSEKEMKEEPLWKPK